MHLFVVLWKGVTKSWVLKKDLIGLSKMAVKHAMDIGEPAYEDLEDVTVSLADFYEPAIVKINEAWRAEEKENGIVDNSWGLSDLQEFNDSAFSLDVMRNGEMMRGEEKEEWAEGRRGRGDRGRGSE